MIKVKDLKKLVNVHKNKYIMQFALYGMSYYHYRSYASSKVILYVHQLQEAKMSYEHRRKYM